LNALFKALNDPIRRDILDLLKNKDMSAGDIADHFNIGKPTVSHHLDLLRQAGLVTSEKQGQFIIYSISTTVLDEILQWIYQIKSKND
jgi:ArsR family transcriptional regulator, arsenate/arsenite/antimonite-responsive transcriptional repressor